MLGRARRRWRRPATLRGCLLATTGCLRKAAAELGATEGPDGARACRPRPGCRRPSSARPDCGRRSRSRGCSTCRDSGEQSVAPVAPSLCGRASARVVPPAPNLNTEPRRNPRRATGNDGDGILNSLLDAVIGCGAMRSSSRRRETPRVERRPPHDGTACSASSRIQIEGPTRAAPQVTTSVSCPYRSRPLLVADVCGRLSRARSMAVPHTGPRRTWSLPGLASSPGSAASFVAEGGRR